MYSTCTRVYLNTVRLVSIGRYSQCIKVVNFPAECGSFSPKVRAMVKEGMWKSNENLHVYLIIYFLIVNRKKNLDQLENNAFRHVCWHL